MPFCSHCGKELAPGAGYCSSCGAPVAGAFSQTPPGPPTPSISMGMPPPGLPYPGQSPMNYAGVAERAVAVIIDSIILFIVSLFIIVPIGLLGAIFGLGFFFSPAILLFFFLGIFYFSYFEGTSGQTPGKQLLGIRVVDETTRRPVDMGRAFIRNILRIIDELPFLYLLGFILVEVDQRKRRLGDMAANTIVVRA